MTDKRAWLLCMVAASIGLVASLWVVPYIPMQDGPQHVLAAHIENHYADAGSIYPAFYRLLPQFDGKGFALIFAPLEALLPWRLALRVTLSLVALGTAWGFALIVRGLDRQRLAVSLFGFVIALPWTLYMGFFPFAVGTSLGLLIVAFVLQRTPRALPRCTMVALLLLVQAIAHVFTAALTGVIVAVVLVAAAKKEDRLRELGRAALMGAPAAAVLACTIAFRELPTSSQREVESWTFAERLAEIARWFVPGPDVRAWVVLGLLALGILGTLVRARRNESTPIETALGWLALVFLLLTVLAPRHVLGWQFLAPRFAIFALALGLALVRMPEPLRERVPAVVTQRVLLVVVTVLGLGSSLVSARLHRQLATGCADSLAGLDAPLRFTGPRLPIVLDSFCGVPREEWQSAIPHAAMARESPLLYAIDHGGIAPRVFHGSRSSDALDLRSDSTLPAAPNSAAQAIVQSRWISADPALRASVMTDLAADGMPFEGIHVVGARPEDVAIFEGRGYVPEFHEGSLFIARYEGCASELVLPEGALDGEPVYYEYGLFFPTGLTPEPRAVHAAVPIAKSTPAALGEIHVPLTGKPCGELWLRVVWDADHSETLSKGDRMCKGAVRDGRMLASIANEANATREQLTVRCVPVDR